MPGYSKRYQQMVQSIRQFYKDHDNTNENYPEEATFLLGQDIIDFGSLGINAAIQLKAIGLIFLKPIQLDRQSALVIELHPDFRRACEEFERSEDLQARKDGFDLYKCPYGEMNGFEDYAKEVFAPFPYLSEEIFLLTEERLQKEIASKDDYRWLLFRTHYRPDKVIQTEILMQNLTNPEADPVASIRKIIAAEKEKNEN